MGSGCSSDSSLTPEERKLKREANIKAKWIDEQILGDRKTSGESIKLLFLGAGESGKSTMLKQMKIIHCPDNEEAFSVGDRKSYIPLIHSNIIQSTKTLVKQSELLSVKYPSCRLSKENEEAAAHVQNLRYDDKLTAVLANDIREIWKDNGIQETYKLRSKYQLTDSTAYFYDRLDDVVAVGFDPTQQDILRARIRTTGIVEHTFQIDENVFHMYDVGGQRNARKKWIHCFENVTSVIFVAALSEYDQVLYEDNTTNRMHEALNLFDDILGSKWFANMPVILFLNKIDIFKEKIKTSSVRKCFPYFDGEDYNYKTGCKFIRAEFEARNKNSTRKVYTHFTNATDTKNFSLVFRVVQDIILRMYLKDVGLVGPDADIDEIQNDGQYDYEIEV